MGKKQYIVEVDEDEKDDSAKWTIITFIFSIFTGLFIILTIGWYFNLSRRGKRIFWLVILSIILLDHVWEDYFLDNVFKKIPVEETDWQKVNDDDIKQRKENGEWGHF